MGPVTMEQRRVLRFDSAAQLCGLKDADVAAFHFMVGATESPADLSRPVARYAHGEQPTGLQYTADLAQYRFIVMDMFQHFAADDLVETVIRKRQSCGVGHLQRKIFPGAVRFSKRCKALAGNAQIAD